MVRPGSRAALLAHDGPASAFWPSVLVVRHLATRLPSERYGDRYGRDDEGDGGSARGIRGGHSPTGRRRWGRRSSSTPCRSRWTTWPGGAAPAGAGGHRGSDDRPGASVGRSGAWQVRFGRNRGVNPGVTMDAGPLIALDRADRRVIVLLGRADPTGAARHRPRCRALPKRSATPPGRPGSPACCDSLEPGSHHWTAWTRPTSGDCSPPAAPATPTTCACSTPTWHSTAPERRTVQPARTPRGRVGTRTAALGRELERRGSQDIWCFVPVPKTWRALAAAVPVGLFRV
ncbi:hypothetical protein Namu_2657 [Nakamurella multipartita DSM 44233]|uniref:Uncharacterized protein n=1 Tax=Nakamurella multipartita (strain ATCC 700099 / DSM 44233 / CIP 104796 / JCM 9543 / NBRC 105858 / Y-104) TaxID=479431 RepID=C8X7Q1_NAKMY|nr:hypothetical protein Namu_2657 [Nakamurella multipartita DSM 44233]